MLKTGEASSQPGLLTLPQSLALVGAGKMGGAMLEGWLAVGLPADALSVFDPKPSPELVTLADQRGIALNATPETLGTPEAVVLAVKPQGLEAAIPLVGQLAGEDTLLLSILAGKTIADLQGRLPAARAVVRAMPNLPASIRRGATAAVASPGTSQAQRRIADSLLKAVGTVEWLEREDLVDAVTAVSGSGPAYLFLLAETLAAAGRDAGLPSELAERLARQTVVGAGELLGQSEAAPATLRENVTSPGGTTAAALAVLMRDSGMPALMREAVTAAKRRARELSG